MEKGGKNLSGFSKNHEGYVFSQIEKSGALVQLNPGSHGLGIDRKWLGMKLEWKLKTISSLFPHSILWLVTFVLDDFFSFSFFLQ